MLKYSTGFRDLNNGYEAIVKGAIIGATVAYVDNGASPDTITHSGNGFVTAGFAPGDKLHVQGTVSNNGVTGTRIVSVAAGTLTVATGTCANETAPAGSFIAVAKGGSLKDIMKDGVIKVYSGAQPTSADDAIAGTLLLTFTVSSGAFVEGAFGSGLEFENDPTDGVIEKASGEVWSGVAVATGTAGWFRYVGNAADAGALSTTLPRIDGSVGTSGADMNFGTTSIVTGRTYTLDTFSLTLPEYYGA